jgi:hypothetical protein
MLTPHGYSLSALDLQDADGVIRGTRARRCRGGVVAHGRGRGAGGTGEKAYQSRRELACASQIRTEGYHRDGIK